MADIDPDDIARVLTGNPSAVTLQVVVDGTVYEEDLPTNPAELAALFDTLARRLG